MTELFRYVEGNGIGPSETIVGRSDQVYLTGMTSCLIDFKFLTSVDHIDLNAPGFTIDNGLSLLISKWSSLTFSRDRTSRPQP